jgi:mono/diheme cytochrome c family protein
MPGHSRGQDDAEARDDVLFQRDIRPLLSESCFQCHGPDESKREAELRLDTRDGLLAERDGKRVVVPGDTAASEIIRRITADDPDERMPPADSGRTLTGAQIELVRRWVEQGAPWERHWSLVTPVRPTLPAVESRDWPRGAIDALVLARLEREGLAPSPEADKWTLVRRATLDLTGLPPTIDEADAFVADERPDAYERLVDRLLASPSYGERMAAPWLDAARFADTSGYQNDGPRDMWRWRDWAIDSFNRNMPWDRFIVEQIAGDMLPGATRDQQIATGFNRNHRGNAEGGIIPEEYAVEYVVDRVDTTFTVFLGLTMGCARCHDHKFDPFTQREFYQVFAYFNNVPEYGRAIKEGNSPPYIQAPTPRQEEELARLDRELAAAQERAAELEPMLAAEQAEWESMLPAEARIEWSVTDGLIGYWPLDDDLANYVPTADLDLNLLPDDLDPTALVDGRLNRAARFDGKSVLRGGYVGHFGYFDSFTLSAWVYPTAKRGGTIISRMTDEAEADGYYLAMHNGKLQLNLIKRWLDDSIRVETQDAIPADRWSHVTATYDGSRKAAGVRIYVDGVSQPLVVHYDFLNQSFATGEPLRIGGGGGPDGRFTGRLDDVRVYERCVSADEAAWLSVAESIGEIAARDPDARTSAQSGKLRACFLAEHAPELLRNAHQRVASLRQQRTRLDERVPTVMVMQEMAQRRPTHLLERGQYDRPGERVEPGVPASLPALPPEAANNRLGFARWLVDPGHPLTARVAVNRWWQQFFGTGLVRTTEDFGAQGQPPSHAELLDWLARELVDSGWDAKRLQAAIVTSSTYRQSSRVTPELAERDADNRLLARGPRFRLSAEMIRDQALAAAGLLTGPLGGPSVKPYQPEGLWTDIATDNEYVQDHGADLYRRSLYTYWKRTITPPTMSVFDASSRETCVVRTTRTNTPLQALALLNEVTFVEAARVLAERVVREEGAPKAQIERAFRLVLCRPPDEEELRLLLAGFERHLAHFRNDLAAADELTSVGEYPRDEAVDVAELAAYTATASVILNLDEALTRK